jgi:hypothetical protein
MFSGCSDKEQKRRWQAGGRAAARCETHVVAASPISSSADHHRSPLRVLLCVATGGEEFCCGVSSENCFVVEKFSQGQSRPTALSLLVEYPSL